MNIRPLSITLFIALMCTILIAGIVTAEDVTMPGLPHAFYGSIEIADAKPVPANYAVEATGEGITTAVQGNPILTYEGGFGGIGATSPKLLVWGTISPGDPVSFLVGGYPAQVWVVANPEGWQDNISFVSGEITEVKLKIDAALTEQEAPANVFVFPTVTQTTASSGSVSYGTGTGTSTAGSSSPATYVTLTPAQTSPQSGAQVTQKATNPIVAGTSAPAETGEETAATTEVAPVQPIPASYIAGGFIIVVIIAGGAWYYSRMGKKD
jgi:hypothetical protein